MTINKPKISVVMPFYNCEKYLDQSIQSVLDQKFSDFEFLIINDASTDGSDEVVKKYVHDPRIVYIKNTSNQRITRNLNMGIDRARADIIARMDGDDICDVTRFEKQYAFLQAHENVVLVGSDATLIDGEDTVLGRKTKPVDVNVIKKDIFLYSPFIHPSVMFRKDAIVLVGKYDERYSVCQDYALWFKVVFAGYDVANISEELVHYRIYANSSHKHAKEIAKNTFIIRKEAIKNGWCAMSVRNVFFMWMHYIMGILISGRGKQKLEEWYKKYFYEK